LALLLITAVDRTEEKGIAGIGFLVRFQVSVAQQVHGMLGQGVFLAAQLLKTLYGLIQFVRLKISVRQFVKIGPANPFRFVYVGLQVRNGFFVLLFLKIAMSDQLAHFKIVILVAPL